MMPGLPTFTAYFFRIKKRCMNFKNTLDSTFDLHIISTVDPR